MLVSSSVYRLLGVLGCTLVLVACGSTPSQQPGQQTDVTSEASSEVTATRDGHKGRAKTGRGKKQTATEEKLRLSNKGLGVEFDFPVFLLGAFDFDINGQAAKAQQRRFFLLNRRQSIDGIDRIFSESSAPGALLLERRPEGDNLHVLFYDTALVPRRVLKVPLSRKLTSKPGFTLMRGIEVLWDKRHSQQAIIRITVLPFNPRSIQPGTPRSTTYHYQQAQGQYKAARR